MISVPQTGIFNVGFILIQYKRRVLLLLFQKKRGKKRERKNKEGGKDIHLTYFLSPPIPLLFLLAIILVPRKSVRDDQMTSKD